MQVEHVFDNVALLGEVSQYRGCYGFFFDGGILIGGC